MSSPSILSDNTLDQTEAETLLPCTQAQPSGFESPVADTFNFATGGLRPCAKRPRDETESPVAPSLIERDIRNLNLPPVEEIYYEAICTRKKSPNEPKGVLLPTKTVVKKIPGAASIEDAQTGGYLTYRSGDKADSRRSERDKELWPDVVERSLQRRTISEERGSGDLLTHLTDLRRILPMGKTKVDAWVREDKKKRKPGQENGDFVRKMSGRNELISYMIEKDTGAIRDRKQIGSHLQVLRNKLGRSSDKLFTNPMNGKPASQDELAALYNSWQDHCDGLKWNGDTGLIEPVNPKKIDKAGVQRCRTRRLPEHIDRSLVLLNVGHDIRRLEANTFGVSEMQFGLTVCDEPEGQKVLHRCTATPESSQVQLKSDERAFDIDTFYPDLTVTDQHADGHDHRREHIFLCEASLKPNSELAKPGIFAVATMHAQVYCDMPSSGWFVRTTGYFNRGEAAVREQRECNLIHVGEHFFKLEMHASPTYWARLLTECAYAEVAALGEDSKRALIDHCAFPDLQSRLGSKEIDALKTSSHQSVLEAASFMQELYMRELGESGSRRIALFLWKFCPLSSSEFLGTWRWKVPTNFEIGTRNRPDAESYDDAKATHIGRHDKAERSMPIHQGRSGIQATSSQSESPQTRCASFRNVTPSTTLLVDRSPMSTVRHLDFSPDAKPVLRRSAHCSTAYHALPNARPENTSFVSMENPHSPRRQCQLSPFLAQHPSFAVATPENSSDDAALISLDGPIELWKLSERHWRDEDEGCRRRKYRRPRSSFKTSLSTQPRLIEEKKSLHSLDDLQPVGPVDPLLTKVEGSRNQVDSQSATDHYTSISGLDDTERLPSDFPPVPQKHIIRSTREEPRAQDATATSAQSHSAHEDDRSCKSVALLSPMMPQYSASAIQQPSTDENLLAPSLHKPAVGRQIRVDDTCGDCRNHRILDNLLLSSTLEESDITVYSENNADTPSGYASANAPANDTSDAITIPSVSHHEDVPIVGLCDAGLGKKERTTASDGGEDAVPSPAGDVQASPSHLEVVAEDIAAASVGSLGEWIQSQLCSGQDPYSLRLADLSESGPVDYNETSQDATWELDASFGTRSSRGESTTNTSTVTACGDDIARNAVEDQIQELTAYITSNDFPPHESVSGLSDLGFPFEWCNDPKEIDGFAGMDHIESENSLLQGSACGLAPYYSQQPDAGAMAAHNIHSSNVARGIVPRSISVDLHEGGLILGEIEDDIA